MHSASTPVPASQPPAGRRTQQERRATTQAALLEATVESLVELGYAATTTLEVERRAGVSRGARIHHFPTKALLLASAVDHLYDHLGDHYEQAFGANAAGASDAQRLRNGLWLMWDVYKQPRYLAVLELNMAARTDDELRARLIEVGDRHRALAVAAAAKYFPSLAGAPAARLVELLHAALLGLLMQRNVKQDPSRDDAVLGALEATVLAHLSAVRATTR
jgi:AcrR family transcriptional regulator